MPAATSKSDLLAATEAEFAKLANLIDRVPDDLAYIKDAEDTSIKDVIAHRAHWIDLFFGWYTDGRAGKDVHFPARGYKWNDLKRYNAALRAQQSGLSWQEANVLLTEQYTRLSRFIQASSDAELYAAPMKGAKNNWTAGRWAEAAGASHFRSASKYIRTRLKDVP
ncbi:MAG: ClbS/DfsB family four-helix bundle protein [Pseudomonadota bacterium]